MVSLIRNRGPWLLVLLGFVAYCNTFTAPLVFDDLHGNGICENVYLRTLWPPRWFLCSPEESPFSSRPLVALTFALNYAVGGLDPTGMHLVNLAIHIASAMVLSAWLATILPRTNLVTSEPSTSRKRGVDPHAKTEVVAWCLAALWLIHPLQTDAVTYITQRTELLVGLAYLGVMFTAARTPDDRWSFWHTACALICLCGVGCKEVMATAPLMVVLADRAFRYDSWQETWRRRWPLYLALLATWIPLAGFIWMSPRGKSAGFNLGVTPWQYLLTQCHAIPMYLRQSIWPTGLNIDHGSIIRDSVRDAVPGGLLLLTLAGITIWGWFVRPVIGFIGAWFFIILGPSSSVIPIVTEVAAERRMHLPLLAVIATVALVSKWGCQRLQAQRGWSPQAFHQLTVTSVTAVLVVFTVLSLRRNYDYRSVESIWQASLAELPHNLRSYHSLAAHYFRCGDREKLEHIARAGLALDPTHYNLVVMLGLELQKQERHAEADEILAKALQSVPNHVGLLLYAGQTAVVREQWAEAESFFRRATVANPDNAVAFNELAGVLVRLQKLDEALECGRRAVQIEPGNAVMRENLGLLLANLGRHPEATEQLREAVRLDPQRTAAQAWLDEHRGSTNQTNTTQTEGARDANK